MDSLKHISNSGSLSLEDVRNLYRLMEKQEILARYTWPSRACTDGRWHIYVKDNTTKQGRRKLRAHSLDELKEKVYEFEIGIQGTTRKTFKQTFVLSQQEKIKYVKDEEKLLSVKNTIYKTDCEYKRFFGSTKFEKRFIDELTEKDIEDICFTNLRSYSMTNKTFLSMRGIIKQTFELAFQQSWIDENPYSRINFKKYKDMLSRPVPVAQRVHSDDEIAKMLNYIYEYEQRQPKYVVPYALEFQIVTGMRRGEIPPLTWSDVDGYISITKEQITLQQTDKSNNNVIVNHTKTWMDRRFPITNEVQRCLNKLHYIHNVYYPDSEFLFPAKTENGCITNNVVYKFYSRMCSNLGIILQRDCMKGPHSYRRNAITSVANAEGGSLMMASKLFGNTPRVAETNYYTGLDLKRCTDVLNSRK